MEHLTELNALLNKDEKDNDAIIMGDDVGEDNNAMSDAEQIIGSGDRKEVVRDDMRTENIIKPEETGIGDVLKQAGVNNAEMPVPRPPLK